MGLHRRYEGLHLVVAVRVQLLEKGALANPLQLQLVLVHHQLEALERMVALEDLEATQRVVLPEGLATSQQLPPQPLALVAMGSVVERLMAASEHLTERPVEASEHLKQQPVEVLVQLAVQLDLVLRAMATYHCNPDSANNPQLPEASASRMPVEQEASESPHEADSAQAPAQQLALGQGTAQLQSMIRKVQDSAQLEDSEARRHRGLEVTALSAHPQRGEQASEPLPVADSEDRRQQTAAVAFRKQSVKPLVSGLHQ